MLISNKSKGIIDSCRFCWMCRHICPIGNVTGQERNTARARMLALSLVERGAEPISGVADNIYECSLCGACTKECVTGWDPVMAVKEVRTELALNGELPAYIVKLVDNLIEAGNVYGKREIDDALAAEIKALPKEADVLLYLGNDAIYKSPKSAINAIKLLKKAGVAFTVAEKEFDSGYAMDFLVGKTDETKQTVKKCRAELNEIKCKKIVCYSPFDAKMFIREYKEWGEKLNAEVVTFTSYVADLIKEGSLKPVKGKKAYTIQDSAVLARDLEETDKVREIVSSCGDSREMLCYGKDTNLAGNLIMNEYMPDVMKETAKARWINAVNMDCEILVTESPDEYELLKAVKPEGLEIMSIEEVVLSCLQD